MGHRGSVLALCVVVAVSLGGCSAVESAWETRDNAPGPEDSSAPETSTPSPTPTPTPTPTPPPLPPAAQVNDPNGAGKFALYYMDLITYAYRSGETTQFRALGGPECANCTALADVIDAYVADGGTFAGGRVTVGSVKVTDQDAAGRTIVALTYDQAEVVQTSADGVVQARSAPVTGQGMSFYGEFVDGAWRVHGFENT